MPWAPASRAPKAVVVEELEGIGVGGSWERRTFDYPCFVGGDADGGTCAAAGDCGYGFVHLAV